MEASGRYTARHVQLWSLFNAKILRLQSFTRTKKGRERLCPILTDRRLTSGVIHFEPIRNDWSSMRSQCFVFSNVSVYQLRSRLARVSPDCIDRHRSSGRESVTKIVRLMRAVSNLMTTGMCKRASIVSRCCRVERNLFVMVILLIPGASDGIGTWTGKVDILRFET